MKALLIVLAVIVVLAAATMLVLRFYPTFGGRPNESTRRRMQQSPYYEKGKFNNLIPTFLKLTFADNFKIMREMMKSNNETTPDQEIQVLPVSPESLQKLTAYPEGIAGKVIWFGHSALLLELEGKRLLLDPMFGNAPSPFPAFGGKRFTKKLPIELEDLPPIDAVFFSHDHYDHLDYGSIQRLKNKVGRFFVPLGVACHLVRWGVAPDRIQEFDWGEHTDWEGLSLTCMPARHFSGRGLSNRNGSLWCSWVIGGQTARVFFSGDSGYGPHFKEIGEKYGPFDLTLMECGQYNTRWAPIHMVPEDTVQAHIDVRGNLMIPIHWGAFKLALHDWRDPVERAVREAEKRGTKIATPRIGEPVLIGSENYPVNPWWRS